MTPNGNNQWHKIDARAKAINSCGTATAVAQQDKSRVLVPCDQSQSLSLQRRLHTSGRSDTGRLQALSVQLELQSISMHSVIRTPKCWVGSDSEQCSSSYLFKSLAGIPQTALMKTCRLRCSRSALCLTDNGSSHRNVRKPLRCRIRISRPNAHAGPTAHTT